MRAITARIDHLIIAARSLDDGVQWCEATLGVSPGKGGAHPLMGTHNRLLAISSATFPQAYLEIIAVDPSRPSQRAAGQRRWFDLDDSTLQAGLARHGPRLVHFVARVPDAAAALQTLASEHAHIERGPLIVAARDSAAGRLEWQITVRDDGQRLFYGALPTLIQWGAVHPVDAMTDNGVSLSALAAAHPRADVLRNALDSLGLGAVAVSQGAPNLQATLQTPGGTVILESKGL